MKIALAQIRVVDGAVKRNLKRIKTFVREAVEEQGSEAVMFPELALTGFSIPSENELKEAFEELSSLSEGTYIGVGSVFIKENKAYNSYLVFGNGKIVYVRNKYMLFKPMKEDKTFEVGELPEIFELGDLKASVIICYELRFPELFAVNVSDAHLYLVPASWPSSRSEQWVTLLRSRAIETWSYVLGINRWGEGSYGPFGGFSGLALPDGSWKGLGEGEGILTVELDPERLEGWRSEFPAYQDRLKLIGTVPTFRPRYGTS